MPQFAARARIAEFVMIAIALAMLAVFVGYLIAGWDDTVFRARAFVRTMKLVVPVCGLIALPWIRGALFRFLGEGQGAAGDARTIVLIWLLIAVVCVIGLAVIGQDFRVMLTY